MRQHELIFLWRLELYSESDDRPSSTSLNLRWRVRSSSEPPAYESQCGHVYKHSISMIHCSSTAPWVHQRPGVLLLPVDVMRQRCMLDRFCIVRWIKSGRTKDFGHEGRADAVLMQS